MHYFDVVMPRNIIEKKRIQVKGDSKKMSWLLKGAGIRNSKSWRSMTPPPLKMKNKGGHTELIWIPAPFRDVAHWASKPANFFWLTLYLLSLFCNWNKFLTISNHRTSESCFRVKLEEKEFWQDLQLSWDKEKE